MLRAWLIGGGILLGTGSAMAQGPGSGSSWLPLGGGSGGFVPYSAGAGGGLGTSTAVGFPPVRVAQSARGPEMVRPMRAELGMLRGVLNPVGPIRGPGSVSMGGMGSGLLPSSTARGAMGGMVRPPVGSYPFRQPPSLLLPGGAAGPSMAM